MADILRLRSIPFQLALSALAFLAVAVLGLIIALDDPAVGLGLALPLGLIGGYLAVHTWRDWSVITVGEEIHYWSRGKTVDIPRRAASSIHIHRTVLPFSLTEYHLHLESGAKQATVLVASHLFVGAPAMAQVRRLAQELDIPIRDPAGDRARASRWAFVRLVGTGHEWVAIPVTLVLALPFLVWLWISR